MEVVVGFKQGVQCVCVCISAWQGMLEFVMEPKCVCVFEYVCECVCCHVHCAHYSKVHYQVTLCDVF